MSGLTLPEPLPPNTLPVGTGISNDGNVAITHESGTFDFSDLDIFAGTGVECAGAASDCNKGVSNTTFNGTPFPDNGLTGDVDFSNLVAELIAIETQIPTLGLGSGADHEILLDLNDGKFLANTVIDLMPGLTVIDIDTHGNDLLLENTNLVFDGGADAFAVVRVPDEANFTVTQSAILLGDGGIGLGRILFFSDKPDNNTHFNFTNMLVNGVAFWDLAPLDPLNEASNMVLNDVQGCGQFVGNQLNSGQNVRPDPLRLQLRPQIQLARPRAPSLPPLCRWPQPRDLADSRIQPAPAPVIDSQSERNLPASIAAGG